MNLQPYPDQWAFLVSVTLMNVQDIEPTILRATGSIHPLDVNFINEEDLVRRGKRKNHQETD